jgi:hypothetical protein
MRSLPTKSKTSFDVPSLLATLERGPQDFRATFMAICTIRNWMLRHNYPKRLSHAAIGEPGKKPIGYRLTLKGMYDVSPE